MKMPPCQVEEGADMLNNDKEIGANLGLQLWTIELSQKLGGLDLMSAKEGVWLNPYLRGLISRREIFWDPGFQDLCVEG